MIKRNRIRARMLHSVSAIAMAASVSAARGARIGDVFVIPLENHNFTQPGSYTSQQQLKGNTAAPYFNSLITPGNANAANVSYAANYTNSGTGVHPSEPNYIWSEAGTNYNPGTGATILSDSDPSAANKNIFSGTPHLTGLMNTAGVTWKNYQEDYQISGQGAGVTASGTLPGGATNPYNHSTLYAYAPKHDPMAFFSDTATENLYPISRLATDLTANTVGQYNWITPDLYNDMHSYLSAGFTYHGVPYTGDQAAIAEGDNFLSIVIPEIEASSAFKNNGLIVIWDDETEGGDTTGFTIPEVVISPLAKGNAYASSVALNHSSDIRTMQEIFGLGSTYLSNSIPSAEYSPANGSGTYNTPASSNDLGDLFQSGVITPLPITWSGGTGNWSTAAKWIGNAVPNNPAGEVLIDGGNPAASVVTLDQNASAGNLVLDANDKLVINAGETLTLSGTTSTTLNGTFVSSGSIHAQSLAVAATGTFTLNSSGTLAVSAIFTNNGTTILNGSQNWSSGAVFNNSAGATSFGTDAGSNGSNLTINVLTGNVSFASTQHLAGLNISTGATATLTGGGSGHLSVLITPSLVVGGTLDLTGNDLDLQTASLSAVNLLIQQAYSNGSWTGPGLTSSAAAADTTRLTALGVVQNNQSGSALYTVSNPFDLVIPGISDILVKYTYYGDANLDGKVDGSDYSLIDNGYLNHLTSWYNGDFNYDGVIDGSDYTLIDNVYNQQGTAITAEIAGPGAAITDQIAFGSAVPEPGAICGVVAAGMALLCRRRSGHELVRCTRPRMT